MLDIAATVPGPVAAPLPVDRHPCFSGDAKHKWGRIHLPVAPKCNIQCRYCSRKTDCPNESRPGVTSRVLKPEEAWRYLHHALEKEPRIAVAGIAGPGDPFANAPETLETMRRIRDTAPEMLLCVSTNGMGLTEEIAHELAELKVSHVTITINTVDPEVGAKLYAWVRDGKKTYRGVEGAALLLERQLDGIVALKARGIEVKINTVVVKGINDDGVGDVARVVSGLGADVHNLIPMTPAPGAEFEDHEEPDPNTMLKARRASSAFLKQMMHCQRCRADAVGLLEDDKSADFRVLMDQAREETAANRPYVAVASQEGVLVNLHLGVADRFRIYEKTEDGFRQVGERVAPAAGSGESRWEELALILSDCRAVLTMAAGEAPRKALESTGVSVCEMEGLIDDALEMVWSGENLAQLRARRNGLGSSCGCGKVRGAGTGCG
ncbi:MAG: radical SAM protein [Fibrobacteria bacterium]|nr:radical SAM protein [Fibrobacteria bacterium]